MICKKPTLQEASLTDYVRRGNNNTYIQLNRIGWALEADATPRRRSKRQAHAKTTGLSAPQMHIKPLKQANKAYLSKKLNDA